MGKTAIFILLTLTVAACYWMYDTLHLKEVHVEIIGGQFGQRYYAMESTKDKLDKFDLVDPESAPELMLTKILYGYHLMLDTKTYAPGYAQNEVTCNNCHFNGGNTLGGKNRGISLVGVTTAYPRFSKRDNKKITLTDRITNCFQRSLNGKAPPKDSLEMEALVAYLAWISHEIDEDTEDLPWLGLPDMDSDHVPDAKHGAQVYVSKCSICHGNDGQGTLEVPPLWGANSFNDGAGMNTMGMLSAFVWQNMPYGQPVLSVEDALDVAAYIISRPRPHFKAVKK